MIWLGLCVMVAAVVAVLAVVVAFILIVLGDKKIENFWSGQCP